MTTGIPLPGRRSIRVFLDRETGDALDALAEREHLVPEAVALRILRHALVEDPGP